MTDVQKKLLELLTDIDAICTRENIKYYLCDETAHGAVMEQGFYKNCIHANIAMTTDHVLTFAEAVKKENREDRILDSMLSNPFYPDFTLRYGDPNTIMMKLPFLEKDQIPCIAVTIHPIRFKPQSLNNKYYKLTKSFWAASKKNADEYTKFYKKAAVTGCAMVKKLFSEKNLSSFLFKNWCSVFGPNKKEKKIAIGEGKYSFHASLLKKDGTVVLEGREFPVFGQIEDYLNKKYSCEDFRIITPKYPVPSAALMISSHIPYLTYVEKAKAMGVDFDAISKNKEGCAKLEKKVSTYNKKITKYYAIVERTEKRFAMYEKYMPMKNLLLKLYNEERYEELNELLKPYRSALLSCYKKGLGLCFDKEIFEMTMHILSMEGRDAYVEKLRTMVPESHWIPMTVTDYKGELIEIKEISEAMPEYTGMKGASL